MDLLKQKIESDLQSLKKTLDTLNDSVSNLSVCFQEHKEQTTAELAHLQTSLNSTQSSLVHQTGQLNYKLDTLNTGLSQHQQQTTAELTHLQTSINTSFSQHQQQTTAEVALLKTSLNTSLSQHKLQTTAEVAHLQTSLNSKLDSLMATAAQLSSNHQEIPTNISDVQCMDTQQSVQDNLTHQLETIKDYIENLAVHSCGGTGGWRRVINLDMTDPSSNCPSGWTSTGLSGSTCGRISTGSRTCDSATFPVSGGEYSRVCGRIRAYQWGASVAFYNYVRRPVTTIDGVYACGVSLTHGTPRNHYMDICSWGIRR